MEDCAAVGDEDVAKLTAMGEAFLHPKTLIINAEHNAIINGVEILKDVRKAGKDMEAGKYEAAGKLYGTVAAEVLWGKQESSAVEDYLQF